MAVSTINILIICGTVVILSLMGRREMKVKCIKRYSDVRLNKIIEAGTVLEVDKIRADHLIHEDVAELVKETAKAADKGKE